MFSYLRYFSLVSLVLVFVSAYLAGGYLRDRATEDVLGSATRTTQTVAEAYGRLIWPAQQATIWRFQQYTSRKILKNPEEWKKYEEFFPFRDQSLNYLETAPVTLAAIYTKDTEGSIILSTRATGGELTGDAHSRALYDRALGGEVVTRLRPDTPIYDAQGQARRGTVLQLFYPLLYRVEAAGQATAPIIAVLQLQYDITQPLQDAEKLQYYITGSVIGLFLLLITVLFLSIQRAEGIIAKQHELNLELTAAVAAAEAENRDKAQFLANISHELRTPLNAIIGFSEILKNDLSMQLANQQREYLEDIHGSGKHLLSLINDILDYSKAEAGKLEVDVSEIDAIKMVKNSLRLVIPRAEQAQVTLMEDLPTKHFILQTDAKKLKQVLLNILSNAVKFTPAGGEVRISCWHNPETDKVTFEIKDTGVGIAQKDIARVMTPFGQADSTLARRFEGTGLGLPLSKKFVEIMGGTFTLTSEVNKGTTVTMVFPRMFDKEAASKVAMAASAPVSV
jgi:two-component system cell cycle sensor histidine kinase PleC